MLWQILLLLVTSAAALPRADARDVKPSIKGIASALTALDQQLDEVSDTDDAGAMVVYAAPDNERKMYGEAELYMNEQNAQREAKQIFTNLPQSAQKAVNKWKAEEQAKKDRLKFLKAVGYHVVLSYKNLRECIAGLKTTKWKAGLMKLFGGLLDASINIASFILTADMTSFAGALKSWVTGDGWTYSWKYFAQESGHKFASKASGGVRDKLDADIRNVTNANKQIVKATAKNIEHYKETNAMYGAQIAQALSHTTKVLADAQQQESKKSWMKKAGPYVFKVLELVIPGLTGLKTMLEGVQLLLMSNENFRKHKKQIITTMRATFLTGNILVDAIKSNDAMNMKYTKKHGPPIWCVKGCTKTFATYVKKYETELARAGTAIEEAEAKIMAEEQAEAEEDKYFGTVAYLDTRVYGLDPEVMGMVGFSLM